MFDPENNTEGIDVMHEKTWRILLLFLLRHDPTKHQTALLVNLTALPGCTIWSDSYARYLVFTESRLERVGDLYPDHVRLAVSHMDIAIRCHEISYVLFGEEHPDFLGLLHLLWVAVNNLPSSDRWTVDGIISLRLVFREWDTRLIRAVPDALPQDSVEAWVNKCQKGVADILNQRRSLPEFIQRYHFPVSILKAERLLSQFIKSEA